jgi:hypothetical protein
VAAGFLLLALAWTGLIVASRRAQIVDVPLAGQPGKP